MLGPLSGDLLDRVLERATIREVALGETIFLQGEPAQSVYIVLEGWVKLYRIAPSGAEAVVAVLARGRSFGEAVALSVRPYPVSAEAITEATLLRLDAARLRAEMKADPELTISMLAATYVHLQALVEQVEKLKARSGVQRVAEFLLELADCSDGACEVRLPYNKALIAGSLGMSPESLSRAFARLRKDGVHIDANLARIDDIQALSDLASEGRGAPWAR